MEKVKLLQDSEQGTATYGATIFADLTEEEFTKRHLGLRPDLRQLRYRKKAKIPLLTRIPEDFDWRHYNAVTPVKNQGFCGSCWAFSVTGNIEGAYAIKHNNLLSFSEQELVDCDTLDEGCNGGLPENAYKTLEKLGGLESETSYPYDGKNEKCKYDSSQVKVKVTSFVEVSKNETEMAMWLVKRGPMSIGINANAMQFYFGGVSHPWKFLCSPKSLDHGVLIVGYGVHIQAVTKKPIPYWLVKNSWGPHWGEAGYYRVYRGQNTCGIAEMVTSAVVA
jgi:cathepsin F